MGSYHGVVLVTDHDLVEYEKIVEMGEVIVDTRNVLGRLGLSGGNIVKA